MRRSAQSAYADNASSGRVFVDPSCIDCGTCYSLAPEVFRDAGGHSLVHRQPADAASSGGGQHGARRLSDRVHRHRRQVARWRRPPRAFPEPIEGEVGFCGYTSEASFGAWSYFIERPAGNVLMDSPRAAAPLLRRPSRRGAVSPRMVLSHRDDVADHAAFRRRFGCERVMHRGDRLPGLERYVDGDDPVRLADDLLLIPTPGHTAGSACLLYRETFLFTGDHLYWNPEAGRLSASKRDELAFLAAAAPVPREAPRLRVPLGAARPRASIAPTRRGEMRAELERALRTLRTV